MRIVSTHGRLQTLVVHKHKLCKWQIVGSLGELLLIDMFLTTLLRAKQKSKNVVVLLESMVSGHQRTWLRERSGDKVQIVLRDPLVDADCVFREVKKIKGVKYIMPHQKRSPPPQEIEL